MTSQPAPSPAHKPVHYRSPRAWPALRRDPITLPLVTPATSPSVTSLFVGLASVGGIILSSVLFSQMGGATSALALVALSGVSAIASFITYFVQSGQVRRANAKTLAYYSQRLDHETVSEDGTAPGVAEKSILREAAARQENDPPLFVPDPADPENRALVPLLLQNPAQLWQRRPSDPDFLTARVGVGPVKPLFTVSVDQPANDLGVPLQNAKFEAQRARARKMVERYAVIKRAPVTIALREHAAVALVSGPAGDRVRDLARSLTGQVALHHSPREAHIIIATANHAFSEWQWVGPLRRDNALPSLMSGPGQLWDTGIQQLHGELLQREQRLTSASSSTRPPSFLPHLVIVVDALRPEETWLLKNPAMDLALRRGAELGATVVSLHRSAIHAPAQAEVILDTLTNTLSFARPDPPEPLTLDSVDGIALTDTTRLIHACTRFAPEPSQEQSLPTQAHLLDLFAPPIPDPFAYDIQNTWKTIAGRASHMRQSNPSAPPSLPVPIGVSATGETVFLDLIHDGPHGLLIGQTGSGKSELLRSIITAIAVSYSPEEAQFVLVDYKGGIELETFNQLPHTLALLTNLDQAGQTVRFLTMLKSEVDDRQERRKRNPDEKLPHLFVVIDEFAEMVARQGANDNVDTILERVLSILRLGRSLNVHLLFAAQRPEGSIINKLRGYVQYRICLRTNTEDDSKEVLGVPDAALLPLNRPGRGYILRGDYDLMMFQSARVAQSFLPAGAPKGAEERSVDEIIVGRMAPLAATYVAGLKRWPSSLPTPQQGQPTPLILIVRGRHARAQMAWNAGQRPALPRMVAPLGLYDRPASREQDWFLVDLLGHASALHGGPLAVMGDINAGKTTTLRTLLLYFALNTTPDKLRWYVLDPTGAFAGFARLPQSRDALEPHEINVIDGFSPEGFAAFKGRLERFTAQPAGGGRPAALFLVDDYDELGSRHKTHLQDLANLVIKNRERDVYFAMSASRQSMDVPTTLLSAMATKVLLYMEQSDNMKQLAGVRLPFIPEAAPGRGWVKTRTGLDEIQIATPVSGMTELEREENLKALLDERAPART